MYYYIHRNTKSSSSADSFVAASLSSACYIKDSSQPLLNKLPFFREIAMLLLLLQIYVLTLDVLKARP